MDVRDNDNMEDAMPNEIVNQLMETIGFRSLDEDNSLARLEGFSRSREFELLQSIYKELSQEHDRISQMLKTDEIDLGEYKVMLRDFKNKVLKIYKERVKDI